MSQRSHESYIPNQQEELFTKFFKDGRDFDLTGEWRSRKGKPISRKWGTPFVLTQCIFRSVQ
jgi:hypothetical protein